MVLTPQVSKRITDFVRKEPRTIQEIARHIGRSWVTADSYINKIQKNTGLINIKVFRQGTRGAIKVVFWSHSDSLAYDDLKADLFEKIKFGREKTDFDPLEIYQYVDKKQRRSFIEQYIDPLISTKQKIVNFLNSAKSELFCFSGNLSWINMREGNKKIIDVVKGLLERKVSIKILCRIDLASLNNINKISGMLKDYGKLIELKHCFQPLRGFIIDDNAVRLKDIKERVKYKDGEIKGNFRTFYEILSPEWIEWMKKVFWNIYRTSTDYSQRMRVLEEIF
jgi:hypothetical protein